MSGNAILKGVMVSTALNYVSVQQQQKRPRPSGLFVFVLFVVKNSNGDFRQLKKVKLSTVRRLVWPLLTINLNLSSVSDAVKLLLKSLV